MISILVALGPSHSCQQHKFIYQRCLMIIQASNVEHTPKPRTATMQLDLSKQLRRSRLQNHFYIHLYLACDVCFNLYKIRVCRLSIWIFAYSNIHKNYICRQLCILTYFIPSNLNFCRRTALWRNHFTHDVEVAIFAHGIRKNVNSVQFGYPQWSGISNITTDARWRQKWIIMINIFGFLFL